MKLDDFNYHITGKPGAPWVAFLHGLLGSAGNWRRITPSFESDYSVLTFDQRGHGRSFKPETGYDPVDFGEDLQFLMTSLNIRKAYIVGHSMGGRSAWAFAVHHPTSVEKLVIEDIGPAPADERDSALVQRLRSVPAPFSTKARAKEYFLNDFGDPKLGSFFYTNITALPDGRATWNFDLDAVSEIITKGRKPERWNEISALKVPTLLIRGQDSTELDQREYQQMLACNPYIKGVQIRGAGHWVHSDQPEEFIWQVKNFFKS